MKTLQWIIRAAFLVPLFIIIILINLFIIAPLYHNIIGFRFNSSVSRLPLPNSTKLLAQDKWIGHIWANGRHIDYLVITLLESSLSDNEIVNHFTSPAILARVNYPVSDMPKPSEYNLDIVKLENNKFIDIIDNPMHIDDCESNIKEMLQKHPINSNLNHYFIVYADEGDTEFDLRGY